MEVVRIVLGIIGWCALLGMVMCLMALPDSLEDYSREPEDMWLLIAWAIVLGLLAAASFWIATKKRA